MEAKELANIIFKVKNVLEKNDGVALYTSIEKGFERWLQVELCGILSHYNRTVEPEACNRKIDILFNEEWAIDLKDERKTGSMVLDTIEYFNEKINGLYPKTGLVFVTYGKQCEKRNKNIEEGLDSREHYKQPFTCVNKISGMIWFINGTTK